MVSTLEPEDRALFRLAQVRGIGPVGCRRLVSAFGSARLAVKASPAARSRVISAVLSSSPVPGEDWVSDQLRRLAGIGGRPIGISNPQYPALLRQTVDAPPVLFALGGEPWRAPCVAIVGSRRATDYGRRVARDLSAELAARGVCVVSGLARGIDTAAHTGALDVGGRTIAVLGCGLDAIYPRENGDLHRHIAAGAEGGGVISEFPLGVGPNRSTFPRRNRIISGISLGVILVEVPLRSGALITARFAVEQNREVFAVPGNVTSRLNEGCHDLIKEGAKLVHRVEDVLDELESFLPDDLERPTTNRREDSAESGAALEIGTSERRILQGISSEPSHLDEIARTIALPTPQLLDGLLRLELAGLVTQLPGKLFRRRAC